MRSVFLRQRSCQNSRGSTATVATNSARYRMKFTVFEKHIVISPNGARHGKMYKLVCARSNWPYSSISLILEWPIITPKPHYFYVRYAVARSAACRLSCTILRRSKFSAIFLRHLVHWPSADIQEKVHGDRPRGTTPSGELNTTGVPVAKYSDFGPVEGFVSETVQDRR